jgi:sugar/nucleoside kinase (ribokinase family)
MRLVVCGHVTTDLIAGERRLGGAAAFAALAAAHLGVPTSLLTAASDDGALLRPLREARGLESHIVPSAEVTTFELGYGPAGRQLRLLERAVTLAPSHVPPSYVGSDAAYIAPVFDECGPELVRAIGARTVCVGLQGCLRSADENGVVRPMLPDDLEARIEGAQVCVYSVEDLPGAEDLATRLVDAGKLVVLTRAERGATLYSAAGREHIAATPAREVDPTGAGDVFGVVFTLGLAQGFSPPTAAARAAVAAAWVVEGPGLGVLPARASGWRWSS